MSDLELIFSMLDEASITEIAIQKAAKEGDNIAGNARKKLEEKSGKKVVTNSNFLNQINNNDEAILVEKE